MTNKIFEVGGSIRDGLLGLKSKDRDFAVETDSFESMREIILSMGGKIFLETPQHFTIRANVPSLGSADYVLCRKDGIYLDGRHPESVSIGTIIDDLARRDFTMNAIAKDTQTGEMLDPHEGAYDIQIRLVRCVGDARTRFNEDALRVIRAMRFAIVKNFRIETKTYQAMKEICLHEKNFAGVSTERIREELLKMFAADWKRSLMVIDDFDLTNLIDQRGIWLKPTTEQKA